MSKPIAIAFSDIHIHDWASYSKNHSRLTTTLGIYKTLSEVSLKYNKIPILFSGDLYHNPRYIENRTLYESIRWYKKFIEDNKIPFIAISGNHDLSEKNTKDTIAPSWLQTYNLIFETFNCIDDVSPWTNGEIEVYGIPYYNSNIGFKERVKELGKGLHEIDQLKVLLIHRDLPNAVNPAEFSLKVDDISQDMDHFFRKFDLVLSGHIHLPQKLGKKVWMVGAPYQQNWGDSGAEMGYWLIYRDKEPKFKALDLPRFIRLKHNEDAPDEKNFYERDEDPKLHSDKRHMGNAFSKTTSRKRLAKNYLKANGEKSKERLNLLIKLIHDD